MLEYHLANIYRALSALKRYIYQQVSFGELRRLEASYDKQRVHGAYSTPDYERVTLV